MSISLLSVWMLDPRLDELLPELARQGYVTARVRPFSIGGYNVAFIEPPNVVAVKESTYILYDFGRRSLTVEDQDPNRVFSAFQELERALKNAGSDPNRGVLFYELQARARVGGDKLVLKKGLHMGVSNALDLDLEVVPTSVVSASGDPNSTRWFQLDIRPIWSSWGGEKTYYEAVLIYRDDREAVLRILGSINLVFETLLRELGGSL